MYTNADGLPNKLDELKSRIHACKVKPSIISVTEVKHKSKWDIYMAELCRRIGPACRTGSVRQKLVIIVINYVTDYNEQAVVIVG